MHRVSASVVTLTLAPVPDGDGLVADRPELERLVEAAAGIRALRYEGPLYEHVDVVDDGMVRCVVRLDPRPTYGPRQPGPQPGKPGNLVADGREPGGGRLHAHRHLTGTVIACLPARGCTSPTAPDEPVLRRAEH